MGTVNYLLDTHALLWWWGQPDRLSHRALTLLREPGNTIFISAASALEIAIKTRIQKLPGGRRIIASWEERLREDGFIEMPVHPRHTFRAGLIPAARRDPFDRLIAAQGIIEEMPVIGADRKIADLGAETAW